VVISKSELLSFYDKEFRRAKVSHLYINARELVPEDELKRYYEKHKEEEFIQPQVKMQHILLPLSPSPSPQEEDRVRRIIEEIVKAYQEKKVPFEALAQQISADRETGPKGGTLTPFFKGELEEKFGKSFDYGVFQAKIGELQAIRGIKGYHIIRVNSREPTTMPFMIAKRFIKEKLAPDYKKKAKRLAKWVINQIKEDKLTFEKALNLGTYSHSKKELRVCILSKLFFSPKTPMSKWEELEREELTIGRLVIPQISKAIFSLQPNQVSSKPISTPFGYHIFKLHEILEAPGEEFPDYEAEAKLIYIREKQDKIFADYYKNLYKRAQIKQNKLL
jgi:parvulin-like peptidyl-prolyl isomerase